MNQKKVGNFCFKAISIFRNAPGKKWKKYEKIDILDGYLEQLCLKKKNIQKLQ